MQYLFPDLCLGSRKFPKRDFAKFVGNTVEQMNTAKINEFNRQAEINFDAHWKAIDKALYADPTLLGPILIYLSNAVNSKTHVHRSGAKYTAYDKTAKGRYQLKGFGARGSKPTIGLGEQS